MSEKLINTLRERNKTLLSQLVEAEKQRDSARTETALLVGIRTTPEPVRDNRFQRLADDIRYDGSVMFHGDREGTILDALEAAQNESQTLDAMAEQTARMIKARELLTELVDDLGDMHRDIVRSVIELLHG